MINLENSNPLTTINTNEIDSDSSTINYNTFPKIDLNLILQAQINKNKRLLNQQASFPYSIEPIDTDLHAPEQAIETYQQITLSANSLLENAIKRARNSAIDNN